MLKHRANMLQPPFQVGLIDHQGGASRMTEA